MKKSSRTVHNANINHKEKLTKTQKVALFITDKIGTMTCAVIFAVIGIMGVIGAWTNNLQLTLIIGSVSGYFLQLVLLPLLMIGQNLQSVHSEHIAEASYKNMLDMHKHIDEIYDIILLNKKK